MAYWYNVITKSVETDDNRSGSADVLGPFETREAAQAATDNAHRRAAAADMEDAAWSDGGTKTD